MTRIEEGGEVERTLRALSAAAADGILDVTALGVTWDRDGALMAFAGIDPYRDPRTTRWAPGNGLVDRLMRWVVQRLGPVPAPGVRYYSNETGGPEAWTRRVGVVPWRRLLMLLRHLVERRRWTMSEYVERVVHVPVAHADLHTRDQLRSLGSEFEGSLVIIYLSRPTLVGAVSTRGKRNPPATAGGCIETNAGPYVATAGHAVVVEEDTIELRRSHLLPWKRHIGSARSAYVSNPDALNRGQVPDIAILHPLDFDPRKTFDRRIGNPWTPPGTGREICSWTGARTGRHEAAIIAIAHPAACDATTYRARLLVAQPGRNVGKKGDSGSAVATDTKEFVGHFIAVAGLAAKGAYGAAWVQDADVAFEALQSVGLQPTGEVWIRS